MCLDLLLGLGVVCWLHLDLVAIAADDSSVNLGVIDPPKANELGALLSCLVSLVALGPFDVRLCLSCRAQDLPVRAHVGLELHSGTDKTFVFS